jgi:hypothetical protein
MSKKVTVELTEQQARQVYLLLNFSDNSILAGVRKSYSRYKTEKFLRYELIENDTYEAWNVVRNAMVKAGVPTPSKVNEELEKI